MLKRLTCEGSICSSSAHDEADKMECTTCGQPATLRCSGCSRSPRLNGDAPTVYYCESKCQEADWTNHKGVGRKLKSRQLLYRVASVAQQLFYFSQELGWDIFEITRVDHAPIEQNYFLSYPESPATQKALNLYGNVRYCIYAQLLF
jgi:hypothetical protein